MLVVLLNPASVWGEAFVLRVVIRLFLGIPGEAHPAIAWLYRPGNRIPQYSILLVTTSHRRRLLEASRIWDLQTG